MGLVFIDLQKAFDTVDHKIICKTLELYGVQGRELSWFESCLTNRKKTCSVNGVDSEIGDIEVAVPQGSCLGLLLSLIYANDMLNSPSTKSKQASSRSSFKHTS